MILYVCHTFILQRKTINVIVLITIIGNLINNNIILHILYYLLQVKFITTYMYMLYIVVHINLF